MSMAIARVGDIGIGTCSAHDGTVSHVTILVSGSQVVDVEGSPCADQATIGVGSCGHATVVASHSATVSTERGLVHRVGDVGIITGGTYVCVKGATNTTSG